jgi:hypothetical protein
MFSKLFLFAACLELSCVFAVQAAAGGFYTELAHASNARATDRNLGRNFVHFGWRFPRGLLLSGGSYIAGEQHCFGSVTLGHTFAEERWQMTLTVHDSGICGIDDNRVSFEANYGFCTTRLMLQRPRWNVGIGGCLWRYADYTIGNLRIPEDPLSAEAVNAQLTGNVVIRFNPSKR